MLPCRLGVDGVVPLPPISLPPTMSQPPISPSCRTCTLEDTYKIDAREDTDKIDACTFAVSCLLHVSIHGHSRYAPCSQLILSVWAYAIRLQLIVHSMDDTAAVDSPFNGTIDSVYLPTIDSVYDIHAPSSL